MAQELPQGRFNASALVQRLAELAAADAPASKQTLAGRLGQWLDVADAMSLYSALNADSGDVGAAGLDPATARAGARVAFEAVRERLSKSIASEALARQLPPASTAPGGAADFATFQRVYLARQRDMGASIAPLRATVRAALVRSSPDLARLAALDAVLDKALAGRERAALARVPAALGQRFEQLSAAGPASGDLPTGPDAEATAGLARFRDDMQALLSAELELRLQPVAGLIAALEA